MLCCVFIASIAQCWLCNKQLLMYLLQLITDVVTIVWHSCNLSPLSSLDLSLSCRHQFPPTPSRSNGHGSGIPQWQRATPTKPNGLTSDGSSNGSSPETTSKGGLVNGAESGSETASKGGLVNGAESGSEPTVVKQEQEEETNWTKHVPLFFHTVT